MAATITLPRLSDSMEEGTIVQWLKQPGDEVQVGDELAEVETDKATTTCEADAAGTLLELLVAEGETVALGAPIALIGDRAELQQRPALVGAAADDAPSRAKASPVARRLAAALGIDLAGLTGSGPNGRIVKADVEAIAPAATAAPARNGGEPAGTPPPPPPPADDATRVELTRLQQTVARRMAEAKSTQPEFVVRTHVDMEQARALREQLRAGSAVDDSPVPSYNDLVVRACAKALREHPRANGRYRDGAFELHDKVNVGIAVAGEDTLLVPVVRDADVKSLGRIAAESRDLAARARAGQLTAPELAGGTFTVSNLGMFGVTSFTAVLNGGQAAILAVGALSPQPVVVDGEISVRHRVELSLTCDHRILYGADAAAFLARVRALLEQPLALAL